MDRLNKKKKEPNESVKIDSNASLSSTMKASKISSENQLPNSQQSPAPKLSEKKEVKSDNYELSSSEPVKGKRKREDKKVEEVSTDRKDEKPNIDVPLQNNEEETDII
jgi:hypothetical protein